jgi:hypothetical protein
MTIAEVRRRYADAWQGELARLANRKVVRIAECWAYDRDARELDGLLA